MVAVTRLQHAACLALAVGEVLMELLQHLLLTHSSSFLHAAHAGRNQTLQLTTAVVWVVCGALTDEACMHVLSTRFHCPYLAHSSSSFVLKFTSPHKASKSSLKR